MRAHRRLDRDRDLGWRVRVVGAALKAVLDGRLVQRDEHNDDRRVDRLVLGVKNS